MSLFDSAIFDSAIFDTGAEVAAETQKRLWQFYRDKRDREAAEKAIDTGIEAIPAPVLEHATFTPVIREADYAVLSDATRREAQLATLAAQRVTHELEQQAIAVAEHMRLLELRAMEDEEAAHAFMAWLMS